MPGLSGIGNGFRPLGSWFRCRASGAWVSGFGFLILARVQQENGASKPLNPSGGIGIIPGGGGPPGGTPGLRKAFRGLLYEASVFRG